MIDTVKHQGGDFLNPSEYDDSPWTRDELETLAWQAGRSIGWEEMDGYDTLPETLQ